MGEFAYLSNKSELFWQGLPLAVPYLHPLQDAETEYLVGGLFPSAPGTNPPPPELFAQLRGRKDLVYYDWEITEERLKATRPLYQLLDILNRRQFFPTNAPGQKWLVAISPLLGNTITEVTVSAPKELTLVRRSHIGFTGIELQTLGRWIDSPGFPLKFEPPPSIKMMRPNQAGRATNTVNRPKR
jgi:hypothetical protein